MLLRIYPWGVGSGICDIEMAMWPDWGTPRKRRGGRNAKLGIGGVSRVILPSSPSSPRVLGSEAGGGAFTNLAVPRLPGAPSALRAPLAGYGQLGSALGSHGACGSGPSLSGTCEILGGCGGTH